MLKNKFFQEGKSIKKGGGFSGKGFKFDDTEHALANERKKLQKAALGLQDSDEEESGNVSHYRKPFPSSSSHLLCLQHLHSVKSE